MPPEKTYQNFDSWDRREFTPTSQEELHASIAALFPPEIAKYLEEFPDLAKQPVSIEVSRSKHDLLAHKVGAQLDPNRWEIHLTAYHSREYNYRISKLDDNLWVRLIFSSPFGRFIWDSRGNTPGNARALPLESLCFTIPDQAKSVIPGWYLKFTERNGVYQPTRERGSEPSAQLSKDQLKLISESYQFRPGKENWITLDCRPPLNVFFSYPIPTLIHYIGPFIGSTSRNRDILPETT